MSLKIEWIDGAPEELLSGMMIEVIGKFSGLLMRLLVGDVCQTGAFVSIDHPDHKIFPSDVIRYGYLIKPHELEWLSHMAGREAKARPEE